MTVDVIDYIEFKSGICTNNLNKSTGYSKQPLATTNMV